MAYSVALSRLPGAARRSRIGSHHRPFAILGFCLSNLFASSAKTPLPLRPPRLIFSSPVRSPVGRCLATSSSNRIGHHLHRPDLLHHILRYGSSWIACYLGIWLTVQFMQLFAISSSWSARQSRASLQRNRRALLAAVAVLAILAVARRCGAPAQQAARNDEASPCHDRRRILLSPFDVFAHTITAYPSELPKWRPWRLGSTCSCSPSSSASTPILEPPQRSASGVTNDASAPAPAESPDSAPAAAEIQSNPTPWLGGIGPSPGASSSAPRAVPALFILLLIIGIAAARYLPAAGRL